ncbi:MAG: hypothetical protein RLY67_512 [Pseudomonadota bacterium]|jgi:uncharacterized protein (TIGR01244 family)
MTLSLRWLTNQLAVSPQIQPEDVQEAAAAGFRSIVCNRPDMEEGPSQPSQDEIMKAAEAAGVCFAYHPVTPSGQTPEQAQKMGELIGALPKPILAYCRSGNRCVSLISFAAQLGHRIPE